MKTYAWKVVLLGLAGFGVVAGTGLAQTMPQKQTLICESLNKERKECPARIRGGVRIVRLLSTQKCVGNLNWTWNASGIVVTNGCRAEFEFDPEPGSSSEGPSAYWTMPQRQAYDAGYGRGQDDARARISRNPDRYAREFNSAFAQYFRQGYNDGYDGRDQGYGTGRSGQWTSAQSEAYDRGYSAGERDSRDRKNRNYKRYSREIDRANESYFQNGYEDAYDGRARDSRFTGHVSGDYGSATTVVCESLDQRLTECRIVEGSDVQLVRQLSTVRCVRGQSWGTRSNTIWVDRGCRAEFAVRPPVGRRPGTGTSSTTITCESTNNNYKECPVDDRSDVRLTRQLSGARCVEGQSWGIKPGAIWVNRGCRAEFEVTPRFGRGSTTSGSVSTLTCESTDRTYRECRIQEGSDVRLTRQLSGTQCVQGQSWGVKPGAVWVDRGCRAEFEVTPRFGSGSTTGGSVSTLTCESTDRRYRECRIAEGSGVRLRRQLSDVQCVPGQTWGVKPGVVWVDRGCRAEFEVRAPR